MPSFVVGRKTLVAAGHVTTQDLGGKTFVGREGWQSILIVAMGNLVGFKNLEQSLKTNCSIGFQSRILPKKNAALFPPRNVTCRIEMKPVDQNSLRSKVIYFLLYAIFWI